jgi:hypothetical protein
MTRLPSLVAPLAFALALCALAAAPSARAVIETKSNTIDHVADTGLGYVPKFDVKSDSGIKHIVGSTTVCEASSTGLAVTGDVTVSGKVAQSGKPYAFGSGLVCAKAVGGGVTGQCSGGHALLLSAGTVRDCFPYDPVRVVNFIP